MGRPAAGEDEAGMFGRHKNRGEATVVLVHIKSASGDGRTLLHEFIADVRPEQGAPFRATIQEPGIATNFWAPSVGDVVAVLIDPKTSKVSFDKSDPQISYKAHREADKERFQRTAGQAPGTAPGDSDGTVSAPANETAAVQFQTLGGGDASPILAGLLSGDPDQAQAALDALRQAKQHPTQDVGPADAAGPADPGARLARLQALHEHGLISDQEYLTQRERIISGL
jgi:hypothetical protein